MKIIRVPEKWQLPDRPIPYLTKTGIQIGVMHQRKQTYVPDRDMERLQLAFLNTKPKFYWSVALYMLGVAMVCAISIWRHFDE